MDEQLERWDRDSLFPTCALVDGKLYAFTSFKRLPIKLELCSGELYFLEKIKEYDPEFVSDCMLGVEKDIFALEINGKRLLRFNINRQVCEYFSIECHGKDWENYAAFVCYKNYLYIIPRYIDKLVKVEIETGKVSNQKKLFGTNFWCSCQSENIIWLFTRRSNFTIALNTEDTSWKKYDFSLEIKDCVHAIKYNEHLYILSSEGTIYRWNTESKVIEVFAECNSKKRNKDSYSRIVVTESRLYLLPALESSIVCINMITKKTEKYKGYPVDFRYCGIEHWSKYYGYCENEKYIYFAMRSSNYILSINKIDGKEQWIKPHLPTYKEYRKKYIMHNKRLISEKECDVEGIWDYLESQVLDKPGRCNQTIADEIWKLIKE